MKAKDILRYRLKQIRNSLSVVFCNKASEKICKKIEKLCKKDRAKNICLYYPINSEVNVLKGIENLGDINVYLPYVKGNKMTFKLWDKDIENLESNKHFMQPKEGKSIKNPDIIFLPCLGYDEEKYRIGYGKGYYDKTLPKYPKSKKVIVAYSAQGLLKIPNEEHDIKADLVINEL